jgi:DNA-binding transcriptional regulator LsrR (DeoR family)
MAMAIKAPDTGNSVIEDMDAQQIRARVAWLYFIGGLTQQEIADQLGLTRLRVNKTLGQLRNDGSVVVDIRLPMARCIELEQKVREHYQLEDVCVIPTLPDDQAPGGGGGTDSADRGTSGTQAARTLRRPAPACGDWPFHRAQSEALPVR